MELGYSTVYARHEFDVQNPESFGSLELAIDYDDGFIAFLNGIEIAPANAGPDGTFPMNISPASGEQEAGTPELFAIPDADIILVSGANVLAVVGVNVALDSSDFSLRPELRTGAVVGEACPGDLFVTGGQLTLSGRAPVTETRFVRVNGVDAEYDRFTGDWFSTVPLGGASIAVTVEVLDSDLTVLATEKISASRVTTVGGNVAAGTILLAADSPFLVISQVTVPTGVRLTVSAGCEFLVEEGVGFSIQGEIKALGTELAPVSFTRAPCHQNWATFNFQNTRFSNEMNFCEFSRSNGTPGCLTVRGSNLDLDGCHIHDIAGEGVNASGSTTNVLNTIVERTNEALSLDFGNTVVEFCTLRNVVGKSDLCDANDSNNPPARIAFNLMHGTSDDGIDADQGSVFAEGNVIFGCGDQAISLVGAGSSTVIRNIGYGCTHGLSVKSTHVCLAELNTFARNTLTGVRAIERSPGAGGGVITLPNSIVWGM